MATNQNIQPFPSLIFIPDISGFTSFVNNTEITHSQHIIHELLEAIIDANEIDLEVSEIEGDAVLFYREGKTPTAAELLAQVQRMYTRFHSHLVKYQTHRICHCGACSSANKLSLKFVIHHGELVKGELKSFQKIFGKDLIVAHRLLKNNIPHQEYVLVTNELMDACSTWKDLKSIAWTKPNNAEGSYDFGTVNYCYLTLDELKKHIPAPTIQDYLTPNSQQKYLITERVISAPLEMVFSVLTDLKFRVHWIPYLKDVDRLNSKLSQHGSMHRCVINDNDSDPFLVSHSFKMNRDVITFVESEHNMKLNIFYTLRRVGKELTRIERVDCFKNGFLNRLIFILRKKKGFKAWIDGMMNNLKDYCEKLVRENKTHITEIVLPKK